LDDVPDIDVFAALVLALIPEQGQADRAGCRGRPMRLGNRRRREKMIKIINLEEKFKRFDELWSPKIVGRVDNYDVKIVKTKGELVRHDHKDEDELFFVIKGKFSIELDEGTIDIGPGELAIVPKGMMHKPFAAEETWLMVLESSKIKHTGDVVTDKTLKEFEEI
jgi:mannose-6-phosphate isomerase-like protein (cupin superfamily)